MIWGAEEHPLAHPSQTTNPAGIHNGKTPVAIMATTL